MLDKMFLVSLQFVVPVFLVLLEVDLVDGPEAGHLILVHFPDVMVLDRKDNEAVGVLLQQRLREDLLSLSAIDVTNLGGGNILWWNNLRVCAAITCVVLVKHLGAVTLRT